MAILTLVPQALAQVGASFVFRGPNTPGVAIGSDVHTGEECDACPYQKLCFGLDAGGHYTVVEVRDVLHPCGLHDEAKAQVVRVEKSALWTSLETKRMRGTAATFDAIDCGYAECPDWKLCHPGIADGRRHSIEEDAGKMECPMGYDIHRVRLKEL